MGKLIHFKKTTMKRTYIILGGFIMCTMFATAQNTKHNYPEPEFNNEVNYLEKDTVYLAKRLEKNSSKLEAKAKIGGIGGAENGYFIDGERSPVRLHGGNMTFIFSTGASSPETNAGATQRDSMMLANGMDPAMMQGMGGMGMMDPANINFYKAESGKGKRKVLTMKTPGATSFGFKKIQSSDKITFSLKKIREGYWEMVIDKSLGKGEYVFTMMNMGMGSMDGSSTLFAFGVD